MGLTMSNQHNENNEGTEDITVSFSSCDLFSYDTLTTRVEKDILNLKRWCSHYHNYEPELSQVRRHLPSNL